MERPVVLNALLCFVQSYREHPQLENLIYTFFPQSSQRAAHALLVELLSEPCATDGILPLFDRVREVPSPPLFAASDLTVLPLTLIDADVSHHILREIWQLKNFIHDALNGSIEETTSMNKLRLCSSVKESPERDEDGSQVVAASSPESPTNGSISSFGKNQMSRSETPLSCTQAPTSSECSSTKTGKSGSGRKLNDAVRKLTDRLAAQGDTPPENESLRNDTLDSAETANTVEAEDPSDNNNKPMSDGNSDESTSALWSPQDPMAYLNMLRNLTNGGNNSIFPLTSSADISDSSRSDGVDSDMKMEDMLDDCDKLSNDSSPSPSDLSMSRDSMDYEKPFTCGHANCHKRFANKFLLKKHQFIHTGLRPHICPYCSKRFNRKDNLLRHKKTHLANAMVSSDTRRRHTMLFGVEAPIANEMAQLISITGDSGDDI